MPKFVIKEHQLMSREKMYKNFEEAKAYYNEEVKKYNNISDKEFLNLMEFAYIGRKTIS